MANIQQTKDNALSIIDAALTILNRFPNIGKTNTSLSINTSTNPFPFLMDAFKKTVGYDILIDILSNFIVFGLDALEITIKGVLLSNIKNLISCSINPFISDELLREGIVFDLRQLDITDILNTNPLDPKFGKFFYFGCDDIDNTDNIKFSEDFNAFLWYMKNKALTREVWGNKRQDSTLRPELNEKDEKDDGIITLEYSERYSQVRDAEGNGITIQTPYNNCLHVFIGNTTHMDNRNYDSELRVKSQEILDKTKEIEEVQVDIENRESEINELINSLINNEITQEQYDIQYEGLKEIINTQQGKIYVLQEDIQELENGDNGYYQILSEYKQYLSGKLNYKDISNNYYYRRTLIEFNYDYIMSLKLFDSKVVTAQLLDQLVGLLDIELSLSYSRQLIKYETLKMVKDIVETDDTVVSDCFFNFSNTDYDNMLKKAELVKNGFFTINGEENSNVVIEPSKILETINSINSSASKQEIQSTIKGSIMDISGTISNTKYEEKGVVNFGVQMNFIENLMNNLACVITQSVLSPKIYLLILINLKTLGRETNFNLQDFIAQFRQLIASLIRSIRDSLIQYLVDELMKYLSDIAKQISVKLTIEQAAYYARLIKRLIECFKRKDTTPTLGWTMDEVNHADILQEEETPKNSDC